MYEETGIGRPATYASITKTLKARGYVESKGGSFAVTELGLKVADFLIKSNFCFMDLSFTSEMEEKLDKISGKKLSKLDTLTQFWDRLKKDIDNATAQKTNLSQTDIDCPKCSKKLLKKHSKFGPFFACPDKDCKYTANVGKDGKPEEKKPKVYGKEPCQLCGKQMVQRSSKFGVFYGCSGYPSCRGMRDEHEQPIAPKEGGGKKPFFKKWKKKS
jgi:DNA topoisomerase-1